MNLSAPKSFFRHEQSAAGRPNHAERELEETNALVDQQYGIVKRLKRLGSDSREAILLLLNLLDLQQSRQRRLSDLRVRGTEASSGKFKNK